MFLRHKVYLFSEYGHPKDANDLLDFHKVLWKIVASDSEESRVIIDHYEETPEIKSAEYCILPKSWNYYLSQNRISEVEKAVSRASEAEKKTVIFSYGDHPAKIPFKNIIVFEQSGYRSRSGTMAQYYGLPNLISDYQKLYSSLGIFNRPYNQIPVVGFCGLAGGGIARYVLRYLRIISMQLKSRMGIFQWEPISLETSRFRKQILDTIAKQSGVHTNYILRQKYRAGYTPREKDPYHPTRFDFVRNILGSDYTVCVRGRGNFSVRFYETLSLGRIPVFVDTDCLIPFHDKVDWRKEICWIDENEVSQVGQRIVEFHKKNRDTFIPIQNKMRKIWEEYFTKPGFYKNFSELNFNFRK